MGGTSLGCKFEFFSSSKIIKSRQQACLESKIMHDNNISDVQVWVVCIWKDADSHSIFVNIVLKVKTLNILAKSLQLMMIIAFSSPVTSSDVESLASGNPP